MKNRKAYLRPGTRPAQRGAGKLPFACFFSLLILCTLLLALPAYAKSTGKKDWDVTLNGKDTSRGDNEKANVGTAVISSIMNVTNGARITWSSVSGADGYHVYRCLPSAKTYSLLTTIKSGKTVSVVDTKASPGQIYLYTVRAYAIVDGKETLGGYKNGAKNIYLPRPAAPKLANTTDGIKVTWSASKGAQGYVLYRATPSMKTLSKLSTISSSASYLDQKITEGVKYTYGLRSYKNYDKVTYYSYGTVRTSSLTRKTPSSENPGGDNNNGNVVYRGLFIGNGKYDNLDIEDLSFPAYDAKVMFTAADDGGYNHVASYNNLTKSEILAKIKSTLGSADNNDVSLFFYSGHGSRTSPNVGSLIGVDGSYLSPRELATALNAIRGKVIVILNCTGSGAAITATKGDGKSKEASPKACNKALIKAFSSLDSADTAKNGELRVNNKFYVLTSSGASQGCRGYSTGKYAYSYFVLGLSSGLGYFHNSMSSWLGRMPADTNQDGKVTLEEAFVFSSNFLTIIYHIKEFSQNAMRYPAGSNLIIYQR